MNILNWIKSKIKKPEITPIQSNPIEIEPELSLYCQELVEIGQAYGYDRYEYQPKTHMLSLFKDDIRINIYYTTMTVATCLKHPKQGNTQLFRKNVTMDQLEKILQNPRVHTGKGYKKTK